MTELSQFDGAEPIAIVGMAVRVPGANDLTAFWRNLVDGVDSVTFLSREVLLARGVDEAELDDPSYVPAAHVFDEMEYFDAGLFGMNAREAEFTDPQLRVFLEQSHAALVDAGYDPARYPGDIGVYAGVGAADYQWLHIRRNRRAMASAGVFSLAIGNNPDYVATTVSYRLNLRGPSLTVKTACSSSLVAVHLAAEALRGGECDMALAGGVNVDLPHGQGHLSSDGFLSPDGHCRPFDAQASGTAWGNGVGVAVLKRLSDALADGDTIHALVLGNAINNDGAAKVGYSAPSVEGQSEVIRQALGVAGVDPREIGYVEAHGTGTALGDVLEVAALNSVYTAGTSDRGWCGLGSVKSNIGHLSQAAGILGVIKTALALKHGIIPPTVNFTEPNPRMEIDSTAFYVASTLSKWDSGASPRRAGVSSFGIGGTNAHVVMQEPAARDQPVGVSPGQPQLLQLSARTPTALAASVSRLAERLAHADEQLDDVAYTLRVGRAVYRHRAAVVATSGPDAAEALAGGKRLIVGEATDPAPRVALLFSGQGAQYAGMGADLYRTEPVFAAAVDECAEILRGELGEDIRALLFPADDQRVAADERLRQTALTQPALFTIEYALAVLWRGWGVRPAAMIGHSIGEYVAATLAGVFTLPDVLRLVAIRGRLMQSMPAGAMLAVRRGEAETALSLPAGLSIAVVNGPGTCVVAGPVEAIEAFAQQLGGRSASTMLRTSHAYHSAMMAPVMDDFAAAVAAVPRRAPSERFLSNVTGDWITDAQATDPRYWADHMRQTVRFGDCVSRLLAEPGHWTLLECGPGRQLANLVKMQLERSAAAPPYSLPGAGDRGGDVATIQAAAARLWVCGVPVDVGAGRPPAHRVSLPGYPYERSYHWVDADQTSTVDRPVARRRRRVEDWFEVPVWRQLAPTPPSEQLSRCLLFAGDARGESLAAALRSTGVDVVAVRPAAAFAETTDGFELRPGVGADYERLLAALGEGTGLPDRIVHAWALRGSDLELGFYSLLWLTQALATAGVAGIRLDVLTAGTVAVRGNDVTDPQHATVTGVVQVAPLEIPGLSAVLVDLDPAGVTPADVLAQLGRPITAPLVALRGTRRWVRAYEPATAAAATPVLRDGGRYLITGGLGGIGITVAEELATRHRARLVLLSRSGLPPRAEWDAHLAVHGARERIGRAITAIRRMEAAGATVLSIAADVTNPAEMRAVRDEVAAALGGLDGIVHAAGVPGGGMIEVKERAVAERVLAPKIAGTLALAEAFADVPLDFVALCSSVTGIAGDFGQVDYCAANAFLDAYAGSVHGWRGRVVSVNWGGWLEVGMAAEVAAPAALRALRGDSTVSSVDHPVLTELVGGQTLVSGESVAVRGRVSASTHWLLDEHRIRSVPVVPGTGHLENIRAAVVAAVPAPAGAAIGSSIVELRDVAFVSPLSVLDGATAEVTVSLTRDTVDGAHQVDVEVTSLADGSGRSHVVGSAGWVDPGPAPVVDVAAIRARCTRPRGADDAVHPEATRSSVLSFGPRWDCLREAYVGDGEELALIDAGELIRAELGRWFLHPVLLDVATAFGSSRGSGSYLPLSYGRLLARAPLPARFYSHLRYQDQDTDEVIAADLTLFDEAGRELVSISDFLLRRVDPDAVGAVLAPASESSSPVAGGSAAPVRNGARAANEHPSGIGPADGAEALFRLLASAELGEQVIISVTPITDVIDQARLVTTETVETSLGGVRGGALIAGVHTPPRTPLETAIAEVWSDVLRVDQVGADSDFFDLGGNSLVAVQLIAQIRRATGVRLPMRVLFEASTVAALAARIEQISAEEANKTGEPAAGTTQSAIPRLDRA